MDGFNFTRVVTRAEETVRVDTEPKLLVVDEQGHLPIDFNTCSKAKKKRTLVQSPGYTNYQHGSARASKSGHPFRCMFGFQKRRTLRKDLPEEPSVCAAGEISPFKQPSDTVAGGNLFAEGLGWLNAQSSVQEVHL